MHTRKFLLFIAFSVLLYTQVAAQVMGQQGQGISHIDSLVNQASQLPDNKPGKALLLSEIAMGYREQNDLSNAVDNYTKALKIFEALGNKNGMARADGNIGSTYLAMVLAGKESEKDNRSANLHKAVEFLDKSVALANDNGYADVMAMFSKDLNEAAKMLGNEETAQPASADGNIKIAAATTAKEDTATPQQQATGGDKERWFYIAGILVLIILLVTMYLTYKKQKAVNHVFTDERKKSEELLLNILPEKVAKELKDKGMVHPQQFDNVTVIMTDFVGFTTVAERFSPKQLVGELHACFKAFDGMLEKYNVEKIKTVGDAYLAIAGVPAADPNHAANMVALAIQMRDFMLYRKTQLGTATFEMRIGVHSGSVVAGIVGVKKFAYDIWGDTVNLAARMEQNSEAGKINISQSTYELVKDQFHCEYRGEISAKNKGNLKMYFVADKLKSRF